MGTRILSVEDDERIRTAVKLALEDEGWTVDEAGSGEEAIDLFHRALPDVVLIDIMLPGMDGFELCRTLRRHSDVPIVMVTARNDTHDVVAGLEAGADDYLTKPFAPKELSARIRALLRRIRPISPSHARLVFGDLEIIPDEGKVLRAGTELHLTKTEFRLLCELAQNPGRVFSRESLLDKVWGYDYFGDGTARRRARPPPAHQGRGRCRQPAPRRDRARPRVSPSVVTVAHDIVGTEPATRVSARAPLALFAKWRPARFGLRTRIMSMFIIGALLLSTFLAAVAYSFTRSSLINQRERTSTEQAYRNARVAQREIVAGNSSANSHRSIACSRSACRRRRSTSTARGRRHRPSSRPTSFPHVDAGQGARRTRAGAR